MNSSCEINDCDNIVYAKGLCNKHYIRKRKHGDPNYCKLHYDIKKQEKFIEELYASDTDLCIDWPFYLHQGYAYKGGKPFYLEICKDFYIKPQEDTYFEAAHSCGNSKCVNPKHLRWATVSENQMDRVIHGTSNRGEKHAMSRLTEDQVLDIRRLLSNGMRQKDVAELYGVGKTTIHWIKHRKTWEWL